MMQQHGDFITADIRYMSVFYLTSFKTNCLLSVEHNYYSLF